MARTFLDGRGRSRHARSTRGNACHFPIFGRNTLGEHWQIAMPPPQSFMNTGNIAFADMEAAHAFLDIAEQAPEGTVYLRGVELAEDVLARVDIEVPDPSNNSELLVARDRLRERIAALMATCGRSR
ncbi:MAG: hypothetical protein ACREUX_18520 [Burkholderiales bacterium]